MSVAGVDLLLAGIGLLVGFLIGLTGMGGGAIMAPLLILLGIRPLTVVGTDLAYSTLTKVAGAAYHWRRGTVHLPTVRSLALGSLPGTLAGVSFLRSLNAQQVDHVITRVLGTTLMLVAATMLVQMLMPRIRIRGSPRWLLTAAGFVVGVLVGVTSVGSGSLIVALLALTTPLPASAIVGTDLVHACLLVAVAALAHWQAGTIDLGVSLNLLIGALPGVLFGSRLSTRLPEQALRPTLAVVLFATGLRFF